MRLVTCLCPHSSNPFPFPPCRQSLVDSISFFETGERYVFLIDRAGVVVVHPQLIPKVGFGREPLRVDMTTIGTV